MTFQLWSPFHYWFIASPFIFTLVFYFIFKGRKKKHLRIAGIIFSCISLFFLTARNVSLYSVEHTITPDMLPLQVCHFASIVLLLAFLFDSDILFTMAFCFNLPAAFLSIIFADSLANYSNIISWRGAGYIFVHAFVVGITLWAFSNNMIKIKFRTFFKMLITVGVLYFLSIPVNNWFMKLMPGYNSNYFYTFEPQNGTPLQTLFDLGHNVTVAGMTLNPVYILLLGVTGLFVMSFCYGLYLGINWVKVQLEVHHTKKMNHTNHAYLIQK